MQREKSVQSIEKKLAIGNSFMSPEHWQKVKEIFYAAQERDGNERAAFIVEVCNGDDELKQEVESLLTSYEKSDTFIENPAFESASFEIENETLIGQHIGHYKITREIGRGGMGAVYLAQRDDEEFKQRVAIKLVKRGLDTDDIIRRFRHERQILAALNHPNIARLLDGGTTESGLPYFVMEYVEGLLLLDYCEKNNLTTNERLKLFRKICLAVQYAHQNLVIHRDMKPSNIIVTSEGEPKLLDFGIAKLINPEISGQAYTQTSDTIRIMTPEYASPEQVQGFHITTSTDIYSLGVVLYELLTGARPYRLKTNSADELARAICEEEPTKPSYALFREGEKERKGEREKKQNRQSAIGNRQLKGDLDNIVLMALRKEPIRRYASVEQFSEDIRRHIDGLPVIARTDAFSYRASKFITRHKAGVGAALLVFLSLIAGLVTTVWQNRIARAERDRSQIAQAKAERINKFLQETLGAPDPTKEGREVKVLDVLDKAARRAETELADQPEVLAEVKRTIGYTYYNLELYDKGEPLLRSSLKIFQDLLGENHPTTTNCMRELGELLTYKNNFDEAIPLLQKALDTQRRNPPEDKHDFAKTLLSTGAAYYYKGDDESRKAAENLYQEAFNYTRKNLSDNDLQTAIAANELANIIPNDYERSIALYRQAIAVNRQYPERKMDLSISLSNLGLILILVEKFDEADTTLRESLTLSRELFGDNSPQVTVPLTNLSRVSFYRNDFVQAEKLARQAIEIQQRALPEGHRYFFESYNALGRALMKLGKLTEAEKYLRQNCIVMSKKLGADNERVAKAEGVLGECLTLLKRFAEAEDLLKQSYENLKAKLGDKDNATVEAIKRLIDLYQAWKKKEEALRYSAMLSSS